jgi:hypothetical protein
MKDLGALSNFLGIQATRTNHELFLTQTKYMVDLLRRTKMDGQNQLQYRVPRLGNSHGLLEILCLIQLSFVI